MKQTLRPAIAMIELIFALVIIGITLMSAPMLINSSINSTTTAMQQESIAATATQVSLLMTYPWDEATTDNVNIINTSNNANVDLRMAQRRGYTAGLNRQYPAIAAAIPLATNNPLRDEEGNVLANFDDVDDFNGVVSNIALYAGEQAQFANNEGDYIDTQVNLTSNIQYASDNVANAAGYTADPIDFNNPFQNNAPGGSTNIKLINVTLTSIRQNVAEVSNKRISLSAFVCNIGVANELPIAIN